MGVISGQTVFLFRAVSSILEKSSPLTVDWGRQLFSHLSLSFSLHLPLTSLTGPTGLCRDPTTFPNTGTHITILLGFMQT